MPKKRKIKSHPRRPFIGTASWTIPKEFRGRFPAEGSHLQSYESGLNAVEINSSFHRDHKGMTYRRWAETVNSDFRFSVKLSKVFTHTQLLKEGEKDVRENLEAISELGSKLGCLLIQLPPKLKFNEGDAETFFTGLRECYDGPVAFEPRNLTWDDRDARALQKEFKLSRVIADPQPYFSRELDESDFSGLAYFRLHGSPVMYRSEYEARRLKSYAKQIRSFVAGGLEVWCIFDNTTFGFATANALDLVSQLGS